ncbi:hypothetical protein DPEC_G00008450 [Dallia pectoralis]|uniref:Uncharacterized protein n=1 Tax=Dallia pectoralis TaxID=75939 RepID=A0ACC2HKP8_DALPE|nr:hypothetical protein DPEC_G00008450 [Dallia pectoralis]
MFTLTQLIDPGVNWFTHSPMTSLSLAFSECSLGSPNKVLTDRPPLDSAVKPQIAPVGLLLQPSSYSSGLLHGCVL